MNELAWKIIDGLCRACGFGFFIVLILGSYKPKYDIIIGIAAALIVILALMIGKFQFPY